MGFEQRLRALEAKAGITGSPYHDWTQEQLESKMAEILKPCGIDYLALPEDERSELISQILRDFREEGIK